MHMVLISRYTAQGIIIKLERQFLLISSAWMEHTHHYSQE